MFYLTHFYTLAVTTVAKSLPLNSVPPLVFVVSLQDDR